ncbi:MAG: LegC family aminotransferase [Colwellia sp.]
MHKKLVNFVQDIYQTKEFIPLHAPTFSGNEKAYVCDTIDSTFVSSVGKYVEDFEHHIEQYTGTVKAVATVNGTAALHTALYMSGVTAGDLVITQALTFVATCNALYHMGAEPIFVDVSRVSLGLCPKATDDYLTEYAQLNSEGECIHKNTNQRIRAVMPMHTFGHPVELDELVAVCQRWNLRLIEDAAESLGSYYKGQHTGTFGDYGVISFNGNKIITTGGGGMVLCDNLEGGKHAKYVTTTAKVPHPYEFYHDEPGFNYRLPNLNAALGCAQMEVLSEYLEKKRNLAIQYQEFFNGLDYKFIVEPEYARSNYWLNAMICPDSSSRDIFIKETNDEGVMTRPIWRLMHKLPMYQHSLKGDLSNSIWLEARVVNIPSSVI